MSLLSAHGSLIPAALATELVHLFKPRDLPKLCPGRAADVLSVIWVEETWISLTEGDLRLDVLCMLGCACVSVWVWGCGWTSVLGVRLWSLQSASTIKV